MMLPEAVSLKRVVLKFVINIFKCFSNFSVFFLSNCNLCSSMRGPSNFLYFKKEHLPILFVTDVLFVGRNAFLKTFFEWSIFMFLFLFFQNNRVITDPNGFQMWPKLTYLNS